MSDVRSTITILYSCADCALVKVPCDVPSRGSEDVKQWMDATILVLAADHQRRSPGCRAKKLDSVMIPITGTDKIGGATVN